MSKGAEIIREFIANSPFANKLGIEVGEPTIGPP
jgi:hypothetical protein